MATVVCIKYFICITTQNVHTKVQIFQMFFIYIIFVKTHVALLFISKMLFDH